ncbi:LysM peptidoglycan-binding domain-containing protein [Janibacter indicus]|uniref:LysM peptidoglycan-binding domain-containing protein n=1 Tax=Janibacter indicus TaxID=857417 RepID=A0A7L9J0Z8_9MICO|nr:LysM peptidoglycan-binding domain-containing protein [Janibacter indicus]QOK22615.1 LysM peptidoglycan-binding domain-containing protein [Janibacter indicus]
MSTPSAPASRAKGLLALVGVVLLVVGVPWLLLQIGAGPVPDRWASPAEIWEAVTSPDDGSVLLVIFRYAAWLAWLFITLSIVLEIGARLLGVDVPRLPGLSLPQGIARYIVGTAALLFITIPTVGTWAGTAHAAPAPGSGDATTASTTLAGGAVAAVAADAAATAETDSVAPTSERATITHEVAQGESLWSIAESQLGDGARYTEILELNRDTIPASNWISPGQQLQLPDESPAPAADGDTHTVEQGDTLWEIAEDELGDGSRYTEIVEATGAEQQPDGGRLTDPDLIQPGWELQVPGSTSAAAASPETPTSTVPDGSTTPSAHAAAATGGADADTTDRAEADSTTGAASGVAGVGASATAAPTGVTDDGSTDEGSTDPVVLGDPADEWGSTVLGLSGLTAAGLLSLLDLARRRRAGRLTRPDETDATDLERELALVADVHTIDTVDIALRHIAVAAREAGRALPGLRSVRVGRSQLDVQLADPMRLPAPWTSTADPRLWTLAVDRAMTLDPGMLVTEPAPFPALVAVGQDDEEAHVLVNLADARTFAVVSDGSRTRDTLAAMTLSLATSPWADATTVTVVGGHPELEQVIGSSRVRFVPDMAAYTLSVQVQIDPTAREVIVVSGDLDARDRRRLDKAVASSPRVALAHSASSIADGADALIIGDDPDAAVLSPAYLQVRPERLSAQDAARIGFLFDLVAPSDDVWAPAEGEPTLASVAAATPEVTVDPGDDLLDDAPTVRRSQIDDESGSRTQVRWNTPVNTPSGDTPFAPGEDVATVRRTAGLEITAQGTTPGWLSNQITPTPGTPLPPVIAFPERVRELAAPTDEPVLRLLGPVDIDNVGDVTPAHRMRLTELAAYLSTHPEATGTEIDDAMWPNRAVHDHSRVRDSSLAGLGSWLGPDETPQGGLVAARTIASDWSLWQGLVPADPSTAGTEHLEQALGLVRGRPFAGVHPRHYVWAQALRSQMIFAITTAATELARRRLMEGRWAAAHDATVVGLTVEPGVEALWRLQLLATHELGDPVARDAAAFGLADCGRLADGVLEPASRELLATLPEITASQTPTTTHHAV